MDQTKTEADRRRLVANERVKATVNLINSVANTMIATGVIGPLVAHIYGLAVPKSLYWWEFSALWLFGGVIAHALARLFLGDLKP